jgi:pimeloyl-ACP methyl ester carboxylesterase
MSLSDTSVVLVHGAWADGSSWAKVIGPLAANGVKAVAATLPLTSFHDDVAALDRTLERASGSVVLVGHAYAGAIIAATRDEKVKALVYVAALAPDEGETVADVFTRAKPHPQAPNLARADLSARGSLRRSLRSKCPRRGSGRAGGGSAADLARLHHGKGRSTAVEGPPGLVPRGGARSHDRP